MDSFGEARGVFVCNVSGQKQSHFLTDRKETPVLRLCILQPYVPLRFVRVQTCLEENCDVSALIRLQTKLLFIHAFFYTYVPHIESTGTDPLQ